MRFHGRQSPSSSTRAWSRWDALGFFAGPSVEQGDGGKTICEQEEGAAVPTLSAPGDCLVVSVGLNNDTAFEEVLHSAHPECRIDGIDGTLDASKSAPFVRLAGGALCAPHWRRQLWRRLVAVVCRAARAAAQDRLRGV